MDIHVTTRDEILAAVEREGAEHPIASMMHGLMKPFFIVFLMLALVLFIPIGAKADPPANNNQQQQSQQQGQENTQQQEQGQEQSNENENPSIIDQIGGFISGVADSVTGTVSNAWNNVTGVFDFVGHITNFLRDVTKGFLKNSMSLTVSIGNSALPKTFSDVLNVGSSTASDFAEALATGAGSVIKAISGTILIFVMLVKLWKLAERIDGNSALPVVKELVFTIASFTLILWACTHAFELFSALFDLIISATYLNTQMDAIENVFDNPTFLDNMTILDLGPLIFQAMLLNVAAAICWIATRVIIWGRGIQLYFYASMSPIPLALLGVDETRQMGIGFIKNFAAVCFAYVANSFVMTIWPIIALGIIESQTEAINSLTGGIPVNSLSGATPSLIMLELIALFFLQFLLLIKSGNWGRDLFGG